MSGVGCWVGWCKGSGLQRQDLSYSSVVVIWKRLIFYVNTHMRKLENIQTYHLNVITNLLLYLEHAVHNYIE